MFPPVKTPNNCIERDRPTAAFRRFRPAPHAMRYASAPRHILCQSATVAACALDHVVVPILIPIKVVASFHPPLAAAHKARRFFIRAVVKKHVILNAA
jgi:hypothetical protein